MVMLLLLPEIFCWLLPGSWPLFFFFFLSLLTDFPIFLISEYRQESVQGKFGSQWTGMFTSSSLTFVCVCLRVCLCVCMYVSLCVCVSITHILNFSMSFPSSENDSDSL